MKNIGWLVASALTLSSFCSSCSSSDGSSGKASSTPTGTNDSTVTGCGVSCDDSTPCGAGLSCLPASHGGNACKPSSCPICATGKFCSYDATTCTAGGCTSAACGFNYVDACDDCVKANCCSQNLSCADDPNCKSAIGCAAACGSDQTCVNACLDALSAASKALFVAVSTCDQGSCLSECYGGTVMTSPGNNSPGNNNPAGCSAQFPVVCPNNLCCPSQYPQCGGSCGQNCCPSETAPTNTGTCSNCGGNSVCVNLNGAGACEPTCSSGSQCSTGCCSALSGTGVSACLPASYCSNTTTTPPSTGQCHDLTKCVQVNTGPTSLCGSDPGLSFTAADNCGVAAYCRVCAVQDGVVNENKCETITPNGSNTSQYFCGAGISNVKYLCSWTTDDPICVRGF